MRRKRRQHHGRSGNVVVRHWAAPFVLAMLVLRSLVPAGFMLAPVNGGFAVVLCDADATAAVYGHAGHEMSGAAHGTPGHDMSAAAMAGHDMSNMPGHDLTGRGHTHPDPTCPYAQSSGASPIPFLAPITAAIASSAPVLPDFTAQTHAHFGPARQQTPRGPPRRA